MERSFYREYYYYERSHWWFKARNEILRKYIYANIYKHSPLKIINIGAATGGSSEMLTVFGSVTSIEYDSECIEFIREKISLEIVQGDINDLQFDDNSFDLVCAFDVIEHVQSDCKAAQEIIRICKLGGHILITAPALMSLWSDHDILNHHYRRYVLAEVRSLFSGSGRVVEQLVSYFNFNLFPAIYLIRRISGIFKGQDSSYMHKSDFSKINSNVLNNVLYKIFEIESFRLTKRRGFWIGVSILGHLTKNK